MRDGVKEVAPGRLREVLARCDADVASAKATPVGEVGYDAAEIARLRAAVVI